MSDQASDDVTRRGFLITSAVAALGVGLAPPAGAQAPAAPPAAPPPGKDKLIVRTPRPVNLETPLRDLTAYQTPDDLFFVRNNYDAAPVDPAQWSMKVKGRWTTRWCCASTTSASSRW